MKEALKKFFTWWAKSFSGDGDVSSRRLTAFAVSVCYCTAHYTYLVKVNDPYYLLLLLIVDAAFILLLFGIVTAQQVIDFKNGNTLNPPTDKPNGT